MKLKLPLNRLKALKSAFLPKPPSTERLAARRKRAVLGSENWLIATEAHYGGIHKNVPRRKVSSLDHRTPEQVATGGMTGGDRMFHHGYAPHYSRHLMPFMNSFHGGQDLVLCEAGILKGTGLAIWCDLFPEARVIGLDIDISNTQDNYSNLTERGAFSRNRPELYEFDQLAPDKDALARNLGGVKIMIFIDDGLHSEAAILTTFECIQPHLAEHFVYFVEDHLTISTILREMYPQYQMESYGELTIITPGLN